MKWLSSNRMRLFVVFVAVIVLGGGAAKADFAFGTPTNLGVGLNTTSHDMAPKLSSDGLTLYFASDRPGGFGNYDILVSQRTSTTEPWDEPVNLGENVNRLTWDDAPCVPADGLELFFESGRVGGYGGNDIWVCRRATKEDPWGPAENLGAIVNSPSQDYDPSISADGLMLILESNRSGGLGGVDLWVTTRATRNDPWVLPTNLGPTINTSEHEGSPSVSLDGLVLFFDSTRAGYGELDLLAAVCNFDDDQWNPPFNLGPIVNSVYQDSMPGISPDGMCLYFASMRPGGYGGWDLWQAPIEPVVDFNGDETVDLDDLVILIEHWDTNESLCDIGPMPWGDGVVDIEDVKVFIKYWEQENFPDLPDIHVDEDDDGSQVTLEQGQILVVTLESNPSTGYRWEVVEDQNSILEQIGEAEFESSDTGEPPIAGAGGWEIFRFKAVSAGQMNLQLVYRRSWEEGVEPINTFSIDVVVN